MLDFDALVLAPAMSLFSRPITVTPRASQPGQPAYEARGVWSSRPVDVPTENGILSSQSHTLGIRALEFLVPLTQGDQIEIDAAGSLPRVGICLVEDGDDDGQGGTTLTLKVIEP